MQPKSKGGSGRAFADLSWECATTSKSIVERFIVARLVEALEVDGMLVKSLGADEAKSIRDLMTFYILNTVSSALPELLEFSLLPNQQTLHSQTETLDPDLSTSTQSSLSTIDQLRQAVDMAARTVLPQAIGLTDAFHYSDYDLNSSLGKFDGGVYEDLLRNADATREVNLGDCSSEETYKKLIKPILDRGKRLSRL